MTCETDHREALRIAAAALLLLAGCRSTVSRAQAQTQAQAQDAVANVWVDPAAGSDTGENCVRYSPPVEDPGGTVCASLTKAYQLASPGDTVLILPGTFTSQQVFTSAMRKPDGSSCNYGTGDLSGCITFKPQPGATVIIHANGGTQISICVNDVRLQNLVFRETTHVDTYGDVLSNGALGVGSADNFCGASPPHDNLFENMWYEGPVDIVGGSYNTWVVGGTAALSHLEPWQWYSEGDDGLIPGSHDNGLVGVRFQGYNFTNTDYAHHHMECIHAFVNMGVYSGMVFRNNQFLGCPIYSISVQSTGGGVETNNMYEGNVFAGTSLYLECHMADCTVTNNTVRFNTFAIPNDFAPNNVDCTSNCVISGNIYYGNLNASCVPSATGGWTPSYNVTSAAQTGVCVGDATSAYSQVVSFKSPAAPAYDFHLGAPQTADNFVPPTVPGGCPATDIDGDPRPLGPACDAGADER